MEKNNTLMVRFIKIMTPVGNFMASQRHLSSISGGIMSMAGLTLLAAIFQVIANPPVTQEMLNNSLILQKLFGGWFRIAAANRTAILLPYHMTIGLMGVMASLTIAYHLAKAYESNWKKEPDSGFIQCQ